MSLSAKITMKILWLIKRMGIGGGRSFEVSDLMEQAKIYHAKHVYKMPCDHKAIYSEISVNGVTILVIKSKKHDEVPVKGILYLHGGMNNCWKEEIGIARGYADRTGITIWYPIYPALTQVPVTKTIDVIFDVYKAMLSEFSADSICVMGCSFGAQYAFEIINQNNKKGRPVPMPRLVIANSPGGVPYSDDDLTRTEEYSRTDPIIPFESLMSIPEAARILDPEFDLDALYPEFEDFTGAPETYVYYTTETCAGNADTYVRAYERAGSGARMHLHIEPGLMHGYSISPVFPESKKAFYEQISLLNSRL